MSQWIDQLDARPPTALIQKAIIVIDILTQENSELDELWQDSDDYEEWTQNLNELKEILKNAS